MSDGSERSEQLARYVAALRDSPHNLLSPKGLAELESRHIPESLQFAASLPGQGRVLDVGSGGGLPGFVVALARPDLEVHLVEATGKKAAFLAEVADRLGVQVVVHHARAEELAASDLAGTFDVVTARAVAPLDRLAPWCAPFLTSSGTIHAIKGERWHDELVAAEPVLERLGLRILATPDQSRTGLEPGSSLEPGPLVVVLGRGTGRSSTG